MVVIADRSKLVDRLGSFPLPIEVNRFGLESSRRAIAAAATRLSLPADRIMLRRSGDQPFVTDGGHLILDASFGLIPDTEALSDALHAIPGVVEHGLFLGLASAAVIAGSDGIDVLHADR
jgi:ribose 5-phosphate isomerase A